MRWPAGRCRAVAARASARPERRSSRRRIPDQARDPGAGAGLLQDPRGPGCASASSRWSRPGAASHAEVLGGRKGRWTRITRRAAGSS
jgi:hypothetical protein